MAATRMKYVYRIDVIYPEGSEDPDWMPPHCEMGNVISRGSECNCFIETHGECTLDKEQCWLEHGRFRWPRNRLYFNRGSAERRASMFRALGCETRIVRSDPLTFPDTIRLRRGTAKQRLSRVDTMLEYARTRKEAANGTHAEERASTGTGTDPRCGP